MSKDPMDDLIVVLPGIMGSVLEKNGRVVWDASVGAFWTGVTSAGGSILNLALPGDDERKPVAADGVVATGLVDGITVIPGFWKNGIYSPLIDALKEAFNLKQVKPDDREAGNLVVYPYDWRRDLRITARHFAEASKHKLDLWRNSDGGYSEAKVIYLAHSMGGLVARYALEREGLRESARALITMGTPYRGAPQALDYLVNGHWTKKYVTRFGKLTETLRALPTAYQLLPRYPIVTIDGQTKPIRDLDPKSLGLDPQMLAAQAAYHRDLDQAIEANKGQPGYDVIPLIGVNQETVLGAQWSNNKLSCSKEHPSWLPRQWPKGDGTVPKLSAVPVDRSDLKNFMGVYYSQSHLWLPSDEALVRNVVEKLNEYQSGSLDPFRGGGDAPERSLSVDMEDAVVKGEPLVIRARGMLDGKSPELIGTIEHEGGPLPPREVKLQAGAEWSTAEVSDLDPAFYRVTISATGLAGVDLRPVTMGVAVVEPDGGADA